MGVCVWRGASAPAPSSSSTSPRRCLSLLGGETETPRLPQLPRHGARRRVSRPTPAAGRTASRSGGGPVSGRHDRFSSQNTERNATLSHASHPGSSRGPGCRAAANRRAELGGSWLAGSVGRRAGRRSGAWVQGGPLSAVPPAFPSAPASLPTLPPLPSLPPSLPRAPAVLLSPGGYLVDPASSICLSQRLSHASLSTHGRYSETANGSLNQLWFL